MNAQLFAPENRPPLVIVQTLIADHGVWRTLRAVVAALAQRRPPASVRIHGAVSDHLLRDIGLEPVAGPRQHWDLRL